MRSSTSTLPRASVATTTTSSPAITALAAFVPWALEGIRQTVRCVVAAGAVVGADRQQPGELALAAGVGLHAHGVVAGDLGQPRLQLGDQRPQPDGVVVGGERVQVGELGPRDRHHLRRRVELHRARPERDHRAVEGEVAVGEAAQVAQHLVLGVVAVEHGLGEELVGRAAASAGQAVGARVDAVGGRASAPNAGSTRSTTSSVDVSSNVRPTASVVDAAQVEPGGAGRGQHGVGVDAVDGDRVEPRVVAHAPGRRRRSAAAAIDVSRWTRSAIRASPAGPCQAA